MAESASSPIEGLPAFIRDGREGDTRPNDYAAIVDSDNEGDLANTPRASPMIQPSSPPLDVRIDVKGAYIISADENSSLSSEDDSNGVGIGGLDEDLVDLDLDNPEDYQHDSNDIRLPHNRNVVSHMAVDIGGSLIKLCYWSFEEKTQELGGRLNFRKFPTDRIDACIEFMRRLAVKHKLQRATSQKQLNQMTAKLDINKLSVTPSKSAMANPDNDEELYVVATGGGAYKFYDKIKAALGVEVMREDEMECLIIGLDFFISQVHGEVIAYSDTSSGPPAAAHNYAAGSLIPEPIGSHQTPYLLVNIGSGVSMVKVSGPREFERVGGTSLGGGTLWGLLSLLTGARSFEDMLKMAERGDNTAVDMLVGDIYGHDMGYEKIGLKSTTIASTFGKVYRTKRMVEREAEDYGGMGGFGDSSGTDIGTAGDGEKSGETNGEGSNGGASSHVSFRPEDISKSLLYAISNNIGQIAYLHAEKHNCLHIYFGGSFIAGHWQTMATLSYAIKFWSKGTKRAFFLRHEGYLGAVGAFLRRQPVDWSAGRRASFDGLFPLSRGPSRQ